MNIDTLAGVVHQRAGSRGGLVVGVRKHRKQTASRGLVHAYRLSVGSPTSGWLPCPGPLRGVSLPRGPGRVVTAGGCNVPRTPGASLLRVPPPSAAHTARFMPASAGRSTACTGEDALVGARPVRLPGLSALD